MNSFLTLNDYEMGMDIFIQHDALASTSYSTRARAPRRKSTSNTSLARNYGRRALACYRAKRPMGSCGLVCLAVTEIPPRPGYGQGKEGVGSSRNGQHHDLRE